MIQSIPISQLESHPESSNQMSAASLKKLTRHIESTGRYEPLIVRPHPRKRGKFQVINGHHRLRALNAIGHKRAQCSVWRISDDQARLYLATLNRLSGSDIPERRSLLIAGLLQSFDLKTLLELLPEDRKQIEGIKNFADTKIADLGALCPTRSNNSCGNVILDFMVSPRDARVINHALDLIIENARGTLTRSLALVKLARLHIKQPFVAR